jgi:CheY-like chemotaxis protein
MPPARRILLADDDREVRLGVADLIVGLGLDVLHAENGTEALSMARVERIHAVLFDVHMPGLSGIDALPVLRRERAWLPCLLYSGRWTPDLEQAVLAAGALACLKKPVQPELLRAAVRRAVALVTDEPWNRPSPTAPGEGGLSLN